LKPIEATNEREIEMITVRLTADTGFTWATRVNGTLDEARSYFLGSVFYREFDDGTEIADTVTSVEVI